MTRGGQELASLWRERDDGRSMGGAEVREWPVAMLMCYPCNDAFVRHLWQQFFGKKLSERTPCHSDKLENKGRRIFTGLPTETSPSTIGTKVVIIAMELSGVLICDLICHQLSF